MRFTRPAAICAIIASLALAGFAQQPASADRYTGVNLPGSVIFLTINTGGVENGPTRPAVFRITRPLKITGIATYHWNNGSGAPPGTIGLRRADGTMFGPWQATGSPGSGAQNAIWYVEPGVVLQPGTYTIVDSDSGTWAQNSSSGYRGMAEVLAVASQGNRSGAGGSQAASGGSDWGAQANQFRGRNGSRYSYYCPPNGTLSGRLWGTGVYTDDSSVCTAAVHSSLINTAGGGTVVIEIRPGEAGYTGSTRNGVTSRDYGSWPGSFVFVRPQRL